METRRFKLAKLAALWSLQRALKYKRSFRILSNCFASVLQICYRLDLEKSLHWVQAASLNCVANSIGGGIDMDGLVSALEMYSALLHCQTAEAQPKIAIELGKIIIKLSDRVQHPEFQWKVIPTMISLMITQIRVKDAVDLLEFFQSNMSEHLDHTGFIWYFALALDILLDTGYMVESYEDCEEFYLQQKNIFKTSKDPSAVNRFYVNMWLW